MELEPIERKLIRRIAYNIAIEAGKRGLNPMDFVELVADSIVSTACARIEVEPGGRSDQVAGC